MVQQVITQSKKHLNIFQKCTSRILRELMGSIVHHERCPCVWKKEHDHRLAAALNQIEKGEFGKTELIFLGHQADLNNTPAVHEVPKN